MSKFINKVVTGLSSVAMIAMMFISPATTHAATAGEVYKTTDGTVWFITSDMHRRPFTSFGAFQSYGFLSAAQIKEADATVTALSTGDFIAPQDGRIFCATETKGTDVKGECSLITAGMKAAFTSSAVFGSQGYSFANAYNGDSSFLSKTSNIDNGSAQHRPGTLINNGGTIQLVVAGGLWGTPSMDVFNSWGWRLADVVPANSADVLLSQTGVIAARMAGQLSPSASTTPVNPGTLTGEGTVEDFSVGSAEETTISEGESDMELVAFDVQLADDGSLELNRFDLYMGELNGGAQSSKPWDYFTDAHLLVDGDEVASMSVDSANDWTEYDAGTLGTSSQEYRLRFTDLSAILASDETTTVSVAFDAVSNLDSADETATWQFGTETDSFRFTDATGFVFTDGEDLADAFTLETAQMAALDLSASNDEPDAGVIEVDDTADTNSQVIGKFDIENDEDVDANIEEMIVTLSSPTSETITNMVKKLYLYDGATLVGQENVTGAATTFDNLDIDVTANDTTSLTVKADLDDTNDQARYQDADSLRVASVNLTKYTDEMDNDENDITETGSYQGEIHALYANGIMVELNSTSSTSVTVDGANNDRAELTIKFDVTAFGDDAFVLNTRTQTSVGTTSTGTAPTTSQGVGFHIQYAGTSPLTTESGATTLTSTAEEMTNSFKVEKGQTETFTLKVVVTNDGTPDLSGDSVRAILTGFGFSNSDQAAPADSVYTFNLTDYKTDYAIIAD